MVPYNPEACSLFRLMLSILPISHCFVPFVVAAVDLSVPHAPGARRPVASSSRLPPMILRLASPKVQCPFCLSKTGRPNLFSDAHPKFRCA